MNIVSKLGRYLSAWKDIHKIHNLTLANYSLEEIVDRVFSYTDGFFAPIQVQEEILWALRAVRALRARYIVEIGTAGGGTLLLWSRVAHPEATIVSVDLPGGNFGGGYSLLRVPLFHRLGMPGQTIKLIRANSQDPRTVFQVQRYLRGHSADFIFIDADHTEQGVRTDYRLYSQLVRAGGMIAFHDIAITRPEFGVRKLWSELKEKHKTEELWSNPSAYGIGLLHV
jgi:predicted O-methyltransferase YrrM